MEYANWNIRNMKKQLNNCKNRNDKDFSLEIEILMDLLDDNIQPFNNFDFMENFENDVKVINEYAYFKKACEEFASVKNIEPIKRIHSLYDIGLPKNEILNFVHDFFVSRYPMWKPKFEKIYAHKKNNLKFSNCRSYSIYLPELEYSYINIEDKSSVEDLFNAVHEYTHAVVDLLKYRYTYDSGYPFVELAPLFSELLAKDEIISTYTDLDMEVQKYMLASFRTHIGYANDLVKEFYYFEHMTLSNSNEEEVIKDVQKKLNINYSSACNLIYRSVIEKISYVIPIIVAVELYYIYQEDPEKALFVLDRLVYLENCNDYIKELNLLGINLNENSVKFVRELKRN